LLVFRYDMSSKELLLFFVSSSGKQELKELSIKKNENVTKRILLKSELSF